MKSPITITLFFAITQIIGLFTGVVLLSKSIVYEEINELSVAPTFITQDPNSPLNALVFLFYVLVGALLIIVISKFYKGLILYKVIELAVISAASGITFFAFLLLVGLAFVESLLLGSIFGFVLALLKFYHPELQNSAAIISSAGVGALFGFSLGFIPILIFIVLLSLYDYIAVFKTRHMLILANELSSRQLSFSVTAKSVPPRGKKEKTKDYIERVQKEGERIDLGTGDLAVPVMLSVSSLTLGQNPIVYASSIAAGATLSLLVLLYFLSRQKVVLPALPPLCLGGLTLLLVARLLGF
ncbi:MAG: presenilin family intramembrane aspartyl protease [Candidatus Anstonellaceae archaeon]